jgi:hypothetical protein
MDPAREAFDKEMNNPDIKDPSMRLHNAINAMMKKLVITVPIGMRLTFFANMLSGTEEDIPWDNINDLILENPQPYDYNRFHRVNSIQEFESERLDYVAAECGLGPWYIGVCKECGEQFFMNHGEVEFFESRELPLPKRCPECRAQRKAAKHKAEPQGDTAMIAAMKKAGLIE